MNESVSPCEPRAVSLGVRRPAQLLPLLSVTSSYLVSLHQVSLPGGEDTAPVWQGWEAKDHSGSIWPTAAVSEAAAPVGRPHSRAGGADTLPWSFKASSAEPVPGPRSPPPPPRTPEAAYAHGDQAAIFVQCVSSERESSSSSGAQG